MEPSDNMYTVLMTDVVGEEKSKELSKIINHYGETRLELIKEEQVVKRINIFFSIPETNVTDYDKIRLFVTSYIPKLKIERLSTTELSVKIDIEQHRMKHEISLRNISEINIDAYIPKLGSCICDNYSLHSDSSDSY